MARRNQQISNVQFCWGKVTLGNCVFYLRKTQKFEDETSKLIKPMRNIQPKTIYLKWNAKTIQENTRNDGKLIQTGLPNPQNGDTKWCKNEARKMDPQSGGNPPWRVGLSKYPPDHHLHLYSRYITIPARHPNQDLYYNWPQNIVASIGQPASGSKDLVARTS